MKTKFALFAVLMIAVAALMSSCDKSIDEPLVNQESSSNSKEVVVPVMRAMASNSTFGWTYYPDPSSSYASSPLGSSYPGFGGSYVGGYFRASLVDNYGSYSVKIEKVDGSAFTESGTAHIKRGSLYAPSMGSAQIHAGDLSVTIPVSILLNSNNSSQRGVLNIWPMIIAGNTRFFSYPIMIWTNPMFTPRSKNGELMGYVDNVPIYKNINDKKNYQCVGFCKEYYKRIYGMRIGSVGTAAKWYNNASSHGFTAYANGTEEPRVGDAVCWSGGNSGAGHIGIIIEVNDRFVKVAHQNGRKAEAIGMIMNRINSTTLANPFSSDRPLLGIIRKS